MHPNGSWSPQPTAMRRYLINWQWIQWLTIWLYYYITPHFNPPPTLLHQHWHVVMVVVLLVNSAAVLLQFCSAPFTGRLRGLCLPLLPQSVCVSGAIDWVVILCQAINPDANQHYGLCPRYTCHYIVDFLFTPAPLLLSSFLLMPLVDSARETLGLQLQSISKHWLRILIKRTMSRNHKKTK